MTDREELLAQANSFGSAALMYERGHPSYPAEALKWLLPSSARRVLDLGAGTGQLTRQLVQRGLDVVAIEPSAGMREGLARAVPGVEVLAGVAEDIPLGNGTVDAVLVAQAWHWFDVARAVPQVARVLTPGSRLGLVWNIRDERVDWVAELGRLMHRGTAQDVGSEHPFVGPPFGRTERFDVEWAHHLNRDALLDLVASRSYIITLSPQDRTVVLDGVRELLDSHPDLVGRDELAVPYVTRCTRTELM